VEIAAVPGFMKGLIPKCAESIQSKVLVLYWDTFSDADLESLVKGLKGNNHQPFLEAVESKIKNRHQFFMLLKWGFNPRAATTLDFIRRHLKFIESDHDALEVFQWFYAKSEDFEQVTTLIALLADHSPNSESEIKKIAKAPDSAMGAALLGFFRARKKTSADSDDAEDLSYEGDENDDENEIHLSSSDYEISV